MSDSPTRLQTRISFLTSLLVFGLLVWLPPGSMAAGESFSSMVVNLPESLPALPSWLKPEDVLSLTWIESRNDPKARNGRYRGLLQVKNGSFDPERNLVQGIRLLQEYYERTGSLKGAVLSFRHGIGNFLRGKYTLAYWRRFLKIKEEVRDEIGVEIPQASVVETGVEYSNTGHPKWGSGTGTDSSSGMVAGVWPDELP